MPPNDPPIRIGDYAAAPASWLTDDDCVVHNLTAGRVETAVAGSWRTPAPESSPLRD
ncbi:hypothetical protein AB4Z09_18145 [Rhodococcus sp. TAF43]|uniref:hypothetical protein n=1 Tax=Rhodococcus sp. TAF43 TaxID=3237483 RepID=UPI003F9C2998